MLDIMEHIPDPGEKICLKDVELIVLKSDGRSIKKIKLKKTVAG